MTSGAGLGNAGWGFTDVLPYFRRLEADADFGDQPWHGADGPMPVSRYPGLELTEAGAAGELPDLIRANSYSFPHVTGTCAMGPRPDDGAVVDTSGRVHGTGQLSVADASIVPNGPSAFTHIPVVMIAERLSEQIAR